MVTRDAVREFIEEAFSSGSCLVRLRRDEAQLVMRILRTALGMRVGHGRRLRLDSEDYKVLDGIIKGAKILAWDD